MGEIDIDWPWQYNFPPFFTLQTHSETRAKQLVAWRALILNYCKVQKICLLDIRETKDLPLFCNSSINRTIQEDLLKLILSELQQYGHATSLDKQKIRWEIYWHTLEEFANIIYAYVSNSSMLNTVLTFYELTEGDEVVQEEFYKLTPDVLIKVLKVLEDQGKCEMILFDENQGVKFF